MSHLLITSETTNEYIELNFNDNVKHGLKSLSQIGKHVTVMGKARTGKSFLLNAIAGQNGKFEVGNDTVVTKGVHISNDTFQLDSECSIRMIDIEGMGDNSDNYDYSLALPVLAASDLILFNFKGQPRSNDVIKELNLLVCIFKRVLENKNNKKAVDEQKSKFLFPLIILVLRDWTHAESYTPEKYLKEILNSKDASVREIRRCVESIDVCFLPPPADHKTISRHAELPLRSIDSDFTKALTGLKRQMIDYLRKPTSTLLGSRLSTTGVFLKTVEYVCDQLNGSGFQIPDVMDAIGRHELDLAVNAIMTSINEQFPTPLPMAKDELTKRMDAKLDAAIVRFREATQHLTSASHKKMRDEQERSLKENILKENKEKMRENDHVIKVELYREAARLLDQFHASMSRIRESDKDLLTVKREADRQRELFVEGLVNVARKKNFLGAAARDRVDERTARKLLPIDNHLDDFDLHAASEIKDCQIRIERQHGAKRDAELKKAQAAAEELKKTAEESRRKAEKAKEEIKKLEKEAKESERDADRWRRVMTPLLSGQSGGMGGCGGTPWGSSMGYYPGDMMGGGMPSFGGGYPPAAGPSSRTPSSLGTSGCLGMPSRSSPGTPTGTYSPRGFQEFVGPRGGVYHMSSGGNKVYRK